MTIFTSREEVLHKMMSIGPASASDYLTQRLRSLRRIRVRLANLFNPAGAMPPPDGYPCYTGAGNSLACHALIGLETLLGRTVLTNTAHAA
jgi:hypothetical protein